MNTKNSSTFAERVGKKQWMAIVAVLVVGLGAGALILRTAPAKPEAAGHSEAAGHGDGEHHEEAGKAHGKEEAKDHDHDHSHGEAEGHADKEHHAQAQEEGGKQADASGTTGEAKKPESAGHKEDEETIAFTDAQIKAADMTLESAGPARIKSSLQLPGEIKFNEDRTAHVVPRVAGVVDSVSANLGQEVKRGQVLAVLSSPALSEQRSELQSAQRRLELRA